MGWTSLFKARTNERHSTTYRIRADGQVASRDFSSLAAAEAYANGLIKSGREVVDIIDRASGRLVKAVRAPPGSGEM